MCDGYDMRSRKQFIKGVTWKLSSIPEMGRARSHTYDLVVSKDEVECTEEFRFGRRAVIVDTYRLIGLYIIMSWAHSSN
jgi:hypothetical protein